MTAQPVGEHPDLPHITPVEYRALKRRVTELETLNRRIREDTAAALQDRTNQIHDLQQRLDHMHTVIAALRAQQDTT